MQTFRIILTVEIFSLLGFNSRVAAKTPPAAYFSAVELAAQVNQLVRENPNLLRAESIGRSVQGREIRCLAITNFKQGQPAEKSAICVIANVSGTYLSGSLLALETARYLLAQFGKTDSVTQLLNQRIFYFIPAVNVDAAERYFHSPLFESTQNLTPVDDDFDALIDEDGPEDLNGDGLISQMRIPDPKGTWVADSTDARWLRPNRPGEPGQFRLATEGHDNDGDELINEDPAGGVKLNLNFPQNYPQFQPHAGPFMLSEPESRALVRFFNTHPNIVFSIIYDEFDNLLVPPEFKSEKNGSGAAPDKIAEGDAFIYQKVSAIYRKITGLKIKPTLTDTPGSLAQWLYFQCGIPAFCARPWWPISHLADSAAADTGKNEKPSHPAKKTKKSESEDYAWLQWIDAAANDGFIAWQPFQHPQLGAIEIGGFRPFLKTTPPAEKLAARTEQALEFTRQLSHLLPEIRLAKIEIQKPEKSIFLVKVTVQKTGFLPVCTAFAHENRLTKSTLARLQLNGTTLLTGTVNVHLSHLAADGQTEALEWQIFAPKPTTIVLEILTEKAGKIRQEITLK